MPLGTCTIYPFTSAACAAVGTYIKGNKFMKWFPPDQQFESIGTLVTSPHISGGGFGAGGYTGLPQYTALRAPQYQTGAASVPPPPPPEATTMAPLGTIGTVGYYGTGGYYGGGGVDYFASPPSYSPPSYSPPAPTTPAAPVTGIPTSVYVTPPVIPPATDIPTSVDVTPPVIAPYSYYYTQSGGRVSGGGGGSSGGGGSGGGKSSGGGGTPSAGQPPQQQTTAQQQAAAQAAASAAAAQAAAARAAAAAQAARNAPSNANQFHPAATPAGSARGILTDIFGGAGYNPSTAVAPAPGFAPATPGTSAGSFGSQINMRDLTIMGGLLLLLVLGSQTER